MSVLTDSERNMLRELKELQPTTMKFEKKIKEACIII
jgi:hypothetical protein